MSTSKQKYYDPIQEAYLDLLAKDIEANKNIQELPEDLMDFFNKLPDHRVDYDEEIEGEIDI